ncbi:MAG: rhodanese-like domain-containing protein [Pseudomonadota bacterium]|jgi:rhodanese-related sulfurtransferase
MKIGVNQLVAQAMAEIETLDLEQARAALDDPDTVIVDLRDIRELQRDGKIPGAFHTPRGMLEFWVDPDSEYHRDVFSSGKRFVFYCAKGHRSALATQQVQYMGLAPVCHIGGGFEAWAAAGMPVEKVEKK